MSDNPNTAQKLRASVAPCEISTRTDEEDVGLFRADGERERRSQREQRKPCRTTRPFLHNDLIARYFHQINDQ